MDNNNLADRLVTVTVMQSKGRADRDGSGIGSDGSEIQIICGHVKQDDAGPHLDQNQTMPEAGNQEEPIKSYEEFNVVWQNLSYQFEIGLLTRFVNYIRDKFTSTTPSKDHTDRGPYQENTLMAGSKVNLPKAEDIYESEKSLNSSGKRVIFADLNGYARSGEITAIIGPSGAGKTSLLNAICGFETQNHRGSIQLFGGRHKKRMHLSLIPQKDYLLDNLTVYENLWYSSRILNSNKGFDHEANIDRVVEVLNLTKCVQTRCRDLSGGEYKRVSIAQELLRQPDILVLDEPTSGLDSLNCKKLTRTLRGLIDATRRGSIPPIAIVMTIHQPDIEIFSAFDHVYCLAPGGRVVFDGHPRDTFDVLRSQGGLSIARGKSQTINPANLLIEIASDVNEYEETLNRLATFQRKQFEQLQSKQIGILSSDSPACPGQRKINLPKVASEVSIGSLETKQQNSNQFFRDKRLASKNRHTGLFWYHTSMLIKRAFKGTIKDPMASMMSFIFHLTLPFVVWAVYTTNVGSENSCPQLVRHIDFLALTTNKTLGHFDSMVERLFGGVFQGTTMFFMTTFSLSACSIAVAALAFPLSMNILLKEVRNGWYGMSSFVLAKSVANFPFEVVFPSMSMVLIYYLLGLPSSYMQWRMVAIALVMALVSLIVSTQGLVFGALLMDNVQASIVLAIGSLFPTCMLSGYPARISQMPEVVQKLSHISPYRYSTPLDLIIRYGFGMCECKSETEVYLQTNQPTLDLPEQIGSLFKYYYNHDSYSESMANANISRNILGINYDLLMNDTVADRGLAKIESGEVNIVDKLAQLISKLFTFGLEIETCQSVRSEGLVLTETPPDDQAPVLFGYMIGLLAVWRLILYFVVRYKIGSRL